VIVRLSHCADVAPLLNLAFRTLIHTPWVTVEFGHGYAYYKGLTTGQVEELEAYLEAVSQVLVVRKSKPLEAYFAGELDGAFALDFNQSARGVRSEVGGLEFRAKYRANAQAVSELGERITLVCRSITQLERAEMVAAIPSSRGVDADALAARLARRVSEDLGKELITLARKPGPPIKNLSLSRKIEALTGQFAPSSPVNGRHVLLIDDLCQSGTSLWVAARKLKDEGALSVNALVCVKSFRDTDNK
jgi:orotate phosphoribosyltransferase-like protein